MILLASFITLAASDDTNSFGGNFWVYFWGGLLFGCVLGGGVAYWLFRTQGDTKARESMIAIDQERASRHAELEKAQAQRGATIDDQQLQRLRNEIELTALNIQLAKAELSQRIDASTQQRFKNESELSRLNVELAKNELIHRLEDETKARLRNESELSQISLELARRDLALRGDHLDLHDRMMEKATLEIESLKLQIKEQRKRLDEFGTSD